LNTGSSSSIADQGSGAVGRRNNPHRSWLGPDTDALRLLEIKPDLEVGITVGAGYFHQLEVPEQVNAMIERFLAISL